MQNTEIEKAIARNPWHGCKKASADCKNCFVFKMDKRYGRDTTIITKGKTTYEGSAPTIDIEPNLYI